MAVKHVTDKVRFSYAHVWIPRAIVEGGKEKYSISILIPKSDKKQLAKIKAAIDEAYKEGVKTKFNGKEPKKWKNPLMDGDTERDTEEYEGHYFINANSDTRPDIVDRKGKEILDKSEFYSGCYGRASVNFYAYNFNGTMGVGVGLNNLQKLEDGENLSGVVVSSAREDFGISSEDDDEEEDDLLG